MKILILGKSGQLAKAFADLLSDQDIPFIAKSKVECDICDIANVQSCIDDYKPSIIINTSAYNLVEKAEQEPLLAFATNTIAVGNVAKICFKKSIQFVTYSTDYVFDGKKGSPYIEYDTPNPLQTYGLTKYAGEIACRSSNPNAIIIRTNGVYGGLEGSPQKGGNFVLNIIKSARSSKKVTVSNLSRVNPTFAADLAISTFLLLKKGANGDIYHLASEGSCSWLEFAQEIVVQMGIESRVVYSSPRQTASLVNRPVDSVLENTIAKSYAIVLPDWKVALTQYTNILKSI